MHPQSTMPRTCEFCGVVFNTARKQQRFCSYSCASKARPMPKGINKGPLNGHKKGMQAGPDHGQWKGDAATPECKRRRARRRFALDGPCQVCGKAPAIDRHHRNGDPGDNTPDNVVLCCRRCHMATDGRLDAFLHSPPRRGYDSPLVKLTAIQEEEIRTLYAAGGWTQTALGKRYGVAHATVSRICRRDGFRGLQGPSSS